MSNRSARPHRYDATFGVGLNDYLVNEYKQFRRKVHTIESMSRKTKAWGLEPSLIGQNRIQALKDSVEKNEFMDMKTVGHEVGVAFAMDANDPFELVRLFLASSPGSEWLYTESMRVYVRHGKRHFGDNKLPCIDIANILVAPAKQGKGVFTRFIEQIEAQPRLSIFVECIQNPGLVNFLQKRGYKSDKPESDMPSYYLAKP